MGWGWAQVRQDWDLHGWYLGEGPDTRGFDSKKEELVGDAAVWLLRPHGSGTSSALLQSWKRAILVAEDLCGPQMNGGEQARQVWTELGKH